MDGTIRPARPGKKAAPVGQVCGLDSLASEWLIERKSAGIAADETVDGPVLCPTRTVLSQFARFRTSTPQLKPAGGRRASRQRHSMISRVACWPMMKIGWGGKAWRHVVPWVMVQEDGGLAQVAGIQRIADGSGQTALGDERLVSDANLELILTE